MKKASPKKSRDAGSGKYVSKKFAKENPATTVEESAERQAAWQFLRKLSRDGGAIVRIKDLSPEDVAKANKEERSFGDWVYEPIEE
jgi:hypothetical protein